jgi:hypothetical protein
MDRFRAKARQFLVANQSHIAILKLHRNEPLTPTDLSELERIFAEAPPIVVPSVISYRNPHRRDASSKISSHQTHCWREMDSNPRSPGYGRSPSS